MKTQFSFEVPFKHLSYFDDLQDYIFTLSIHFTDPHFQSYIKWKRAEGLKTIWLDNSFNEKFEADDPRDLKRIFTQYDLQKVVVPDSIHWSDQELVESYRQMRYSFQFQPQQMIAVINSMESYQLLKAEGAMHFAVSYWTREKFTSAELKSVENLHFLGLLNIPEVLRVRPRSCDTSMPVKLALKGMTLRDWEKSGYQHINTKDLGYQGTSFFNTLMTTEQLKLARENINQLKEAIV